MRIKSALLIVSGFILLGLGAIGLLLPIWPTTPFVIGAAACFTCAPKLKAKMMQIPFFSEYIQSYQNGTGLSKKTLTVSLIYLWGMLILSSALVQLAWLTALLAIVGISVTIHMLCVARPKDRVKKAAYKENAMMKYKKQLDYFEVIFNILYLSTVLFLGVKMLFFAVPAEKNLFGVMALILVAGDAFHLVPRIASVLSGDQERFCRMLGFGKMAASISMTLFYVLLWYTGILYFSLPGAPCWTIIVYCLAAVRIFLSVLPQNGWNGNKSPAKWSYYRNIPFLLLGGMVGVLFFLYRDFGAANIRWLWLAVLLSFAFYLPVVIWSDRYPALGMLMIPKSCAYVWIISMGL